MKKFYLLTGLMFLYVIYGLYLSQYDVAILQEELVAEHPKGFFDYRGITHVRSDDLSTVIEAAQTAGLDFLSVTDLNIYDHVEDFSSSGYRGNLLVMHDGEFSYINSRLLNIGASTDRHLQGLGRSQVIFADLLSQAKKDKDLGVLILSSPLNPKYQWSGAFPRGLDGLEIINLKDLWQSGWSNKKISFIFSLFVYPFHEKLSFLRLFEEPKKEIELWDELSVNNPTLAIVGAGAEGQIRFPNYKTVFSLWRNHILLRSELTGNSSGDVEKVSDALRKGQFYMSLDTLGNPKGFNMVVKSKSGVISPIGSRVAFEQGLSLEVSLPQKPAVPFDTVIIRNGAPMLTSNSQVTEYYINSPGVYRVMVKVIPTLPLPDGKKWIPWIYTNPIYVK